MAKAFGCRPVATIRVRLRAGVREPSRKGPAGRGWTVACRLWGSDGAAAWVGDAFAGVVGGSDDRGSEARLRRPHFDEGHILTGRAIGVPIYRLRFQPRDGATFHPEEMTCWWVSQLCIGRFRICAREAGTLLSDSRYASTQKSACEAQQDDHQLVFWLSRTAAALGTGRISVA